MYKKSTGVLLLALAPVIAGAGETVELSTIMVTTPTKTEKSIDGVTASIDVITATDIKKTGASTLSDVFNKMPSFTLQYGRFPHPSSVSKAGISIRGAGANGTLILMDGKRLAAETENPYEMDRIPTAMIERIEVVKGPMSTLYGSDAIGGVINVITRTADKPVTTIDVQYGQNSHGDAKEKTVNLTTMGKKDQFSYKFYGSIVNTNPFTIDENYTQQAVHPMTHASVPDPINSQSGTLGVTYRDDAEVQNFGIGLGYELSNRTRVGLDVNYFDEDREGEYIGLHAKPRPDLPFQKVLVQGTPVHSEDDNKRTDISFDIEHTTESETLLKARVYHSDYEKRNVTNALGFSPAPENTKFSADVTIEGIEVSSSIFVNEMNLVTVGAEYRDETRNSSAINPDPSSSEFVEQNTYYSSFYVQDEIEINSTLNAVVGARYDAISSTDSETSFNAGIIKNLDNGINLRANYSQGFRAPDVAELYVVSPFFRDAMRFGSEVIYGPKTTAYELQPETSESFELAVSKRMKQFFGEVAIYHNEIDDKIALVAKNSGTPTKYYTSENIDDVKINGMDISTTYQANDKFDIGFNATLLDTENKATGKKLTFTPDVSTAIIANYQFSPELSSSLIIRHVGKQYTDDKNTDSVSSYTTSDVSLAYQINDQFEIYGGINNIGDASIDEALGATVGRYYYTGIRSVF